MSEEMERLKQLSAELVSPDLLLRLVEELPDALVVVNDRGLIVLFNACAELLFGYHRVEMIGKPIEGLVPDGARPRHVAHRESYMGEPRARPMGIGLPLAARHKSGREFPVEINLKPIVSTQGTFVSAVIRRRADNQQPQSQVPQNSTPSAPPADSA